MNLPYARVPGNPPFAAARVLDVAALRDMWLPWISMEAAPTTHVVARNSYLTWTYVCRTDSADIFARPWLSMYASGGLRAFVLDQARAVDHLQQEESCPAEMKELRDTWLGWLHGDDVLRRLQATALLGTLTTTLPLIGTDDPDPAVADPVHQHWCYERAKAIRARDLGHAPSAATMEYLAESAIEPAIRMLALVHLITYGIRFGMESDRVGGWVEQAGAVVPALAEHPHWLGLTVENRLQRVLALRYARQNDDAAVRRTLARAVELDRALAAYADDSILLRSLSTEIHRLLLDVQVRYETKCGTLATAAPMIAELDRIEPHYPDSRSAIGALYAANDLPDRAAAQFEQAAAGGSVLGAIAAFRAFECHRLAGDRDGAERSLLLLADLDPAADIGRYT
ncbi:hypothetical protein ACWT_0256 [Actinoplanes sp. SE50]|uniref:hypothetical protein n=1 Tax=unclassified Actinoplanes TaxID=2626549 RepID=UPI00023EBE54|nr:MULTISPECIES: hypothetical protein [unclassified Actinoplanes]AEV81268.1 hypothetical protein ACPL_371 [Actinoplanes sp. SE50/110]ATO79671.1 hypothetical protein ACWT_0256 [Actinoplanes sp. SE50]SLL97074.1 hypothetical protein ACSP50_0270 [Actinoplanes sp. SE50/110]